MTIPREIASLHEWLRQRDFKYYTLNYAPAGRLVAAAAKRTKWAGVAWRQLFRTLPLDLRPALGLSPEIIDPQATVILAGAYLELAKLSGDKRFQNAFGTTIARVFALRSPKTRHFAVRQGKQLFLRMYAASTDDVAPLWTAWAGNLFLDAYAQCRDGHYLAAARDVAGYFLDEHPRDEDAQTAYFYYDPGHRFRVWNASCEISSFLVRVGSQLGDRRALALGDKGLALVADVQRADGAWFYGESLRYIDNFHTAFILQALAEALRWRPNDRLARALDRGTAYYLAAMFTRDRRGLLRPRHFDPRWPPLNSSVLQQVDIRDCALAVILFAGLSARDRRFAAYADAVRDWTKLHMKCGPTYCAEKTWFWTNKIPYIDFQAWMLLALARHLAGGVAT